MLSNIILIEIITILYMKTSIKYDYPFCHYVNTRNVQSELEYTCSVPINETLTNGHGHYFINVYVQSQRRWKDKFFVGIKHSKGINGYTGPKELNKDKPYSRSWFSCNQEALPPSAALPNAPDLVTTDCELVVLIKNQNYFIPSSMSIMIHVDEADNLYKIPPKEFSRSKSKSVFSSILTNKETYSIIGNATGEFSKYRIRNFKIALREVAIILIVIIFIVAFIGYFGFKFLKLHNNTESEKTFVNTWVKGRYGDRGSLVEASHNETRNTREHKKAKRQTLKKDIMNEVNESNSCTEDYDKETNKVSTEEIEQNDFCDQIESSEEQETTQSSFSSHLRQRRS